MQQFKSILLLLIMGMTMLPWQLVCIAHPFGHVHHEHDGPSPCELHKMYANEKGEHFLPPMECEHISSAINDYKQTQIKKIVPTIQWITVAVVLFDRVIFRIPEQSFLIPPEPKCRSATFLSDSPLRAPPLA